MKEPSAKLLDKADRAIRAAGILLEQGEPDVAVGRAYYAMFYATEALLFEKGLRFRKHGRVHAAFGEHFVKTGMIAPTFHRWLLDAFDRRIVADYDVDVAIPAEEVSRMVEQARVFVDEVRRHLDVAPDVEPVE